MMTWMGVVTIRLKAERKMGDELQDKVGILAEKR